MTTDKETSCHVRVGDIVKFQLNAPFCSPQDRAKVKEVVPNCRCESGFMVEVWFIIDGFPDGYSKMSEYVDSNWLERVS